MTPPLTYAQISRHFHLPVSAAARHLGVSRPTISKVLRAHGVPRWPYRALRAHQRRVAHARSTGLSPPPPLDTPRTKARKARHHSAPPHHDQPLHTFHHLPPSDDEREHDHTLVFHRFAPASPTPRPASPPCTHAPPDPLPARCYTADSSYPSTAPSDFLPAFAPATQPIHHPAHPAWHCSESLDPTPDPSPSSASPLRDAPVLRAGDDAPTGQLEGTPRASHTVSTKGYGGGGVNRVVFGALNWSRGIFSPDARTGELAFRFLPNDVSDASEERIGSSLSITESELYQAVGSQIEAAETGGMGETAEGFEEEPAGTTSF